MATIAERVRQALPETTDFTRVRHDLTIDAPVVVTSDFHIPYTHPELVEEVVNAAKRHGAEELIVVGDLLNEDELSRWEPGLNKPTDSFRRELTAAHDLLDILFETFRRVRYYPGNHDRRLVKETRSALGMAEVVRLFWPEGGMYPGGVGRFTGKDGGQCELIVSDLPSFFATIHGNRWYMVHPKSYSAIPGKVARDLAAKYHCHVAIGHTHTWAMTHDRSGQFWALDLGGLFDPSKIAYAHEEEHTGPAMTNGFFVLDEGRVVGYPGRK